MTDPISTLSPVAPSSSYRRADVKAILSNFPMPLDISNVSGAKWSVKPPLQAGALEIPCRMTRASGEYQRAAYSHCMTHFHEVLEQGKAGASKAERAALQKAQEHLEGKLDTISGSLEPTATALGAVHEALERRCALNPGDQEAKTCLKEVKDAIVSFGIKMALSKGVLDGTGQLKAGSKEVVRAEKQAGVVMARCANALGWHELMKDVAEAVLPDFMKRAISDRLPNLVEKFQEVGDRANVYKAVHSGVTLSVEKALGAVQDLASNKSVEHAVIALLEMPEFVKKAGDGQPEVKKDPPVRDNRFPEIPKEALDKAAAGGQVMINSQPITVDASGNGSVFKDALVSMENMFKHGCDLARELGTQTERNRWQAELIAQLKTENAALKERLLNERGRTEMFATGPDLMHVLAANDADNESDLNLRHASISTGELETTQNLEQRPPCNDLSRAQQNQETRQPNNRDLYSEDNLRRGSGNGDNGLHRAPPGSEDQVDGKGQPKLDLEQQRLARSSDTNSSNRVSVEKNARPSGAGTPGLTDINTELSWYLDRINTPTGTLAPRGTPADPFQPDGPRRLLNEPMGSKTPWVALPNNQISPRDVKGWVGERFELSGQRFGKRNFTIPSPSGRVLAPAANPADLEFADLARRHNGASANVLPSSLRAQSRGSDHTPESMTGRDFLKNRLERNAAYGEVARPLPLGEWLRNDPEDMKRDIEDVISGVPDMTATFRSPFESESTADEFHGALLDDDSLAPIDRDHVLPGFSSVPFMRSISVESGDSTISEVERPLIKGARSPRGLPKEYLTPEGNPVASFARDRLVVAQPRSAELAAPKRGRTMADFFNPNTLARMTRSSSSIADAILADSKFPSAKPSPVKKQGVEARKDSLESIGSQTSYESIGEPGTMKVHFSGWKVSGFANDSGSESPEPAELDEPSPRLKDGPFNGQVKKMTEAIQPKVDETLRQREALIDALKKSA